MREDFAIFICTHGRPHEQHTYEMLKRCGYTGKIYLVLDNTDTLIQEYIDIYPLDSLIVFDKNYYINSEKFDNGDSSEHYKCILYAKRAVEDIAKFMKLSYFAIADDDITNLVIRFPTDKLETHKIQNLDKVLEAYLSIMTEKVAGLGFGIVISYFKGIDTFNYKYLSKRSLPYQFVLRNASVPVVWTSWMYEDNITELQSSSLGNFWASIPYIMQYVKPIGSVKNNGGMSDIYKSLNMFILNFNIIKYCPQKTYFIRKNNQYVLCRAEDNCFPKLISEDYKI